MATPFLSSEEYDERAHRLYDDGAFDAALETLKEGLRLYPHSVELYVGLGYTRLAREEYVWARQAFERGLVLDPEHEDALVGLGESLLRLGRQTEALDLFDRVLAGGPIDMELLLTMGRALYRERLYDAAEKVFRVGLKQHGEAAELVAGLGYSLYRLGDERGARAELRRALRLDGGQHEARIYLAHILYDRGEWGAALAEFETVPVSEHHDPLAVARLIELRRALAGEVGGGVANDLSCWEERLSELEMAADPVDALLAELEDRAEQDALELDDDAPPHRVVLLPGTELTGSWYQIVRQIRDAGSPIPGESVAEFMGRRSLEERLRSGRELPTTTAGDFVQAGARLGLWRIER